MAISYATSSWASGTTTATCYAINTTGVSLLVASIGTQYTTGTPSISDGKGNIWTLATSARQASWQNIFCWYCTNPNVGTGHTFSFSFPGANTQTTLIISAWTGVTLSGSLDVASSSSLNSISTTYSSPTITTTQGYDLVISHVFWNNTGAPIVSSPFTRFLGVNPPQGSMGGAYLISGSSTSSYSANWSNSTNSMGGNTIAFRYDPNYTPTTSNTWSGWCLFFQ